MSVPSWVVDIFCPAIGTIICAAMWFSPLKAVLDAKKTQNLGDLNPFPYFVIIFNCTGWSIYGCMLRDHWVFWGNWLGLTLGAFYSITCYGILAKQQTQPKLQERCEYFFIFTASFWCFMGMIAGILYGTSEYDRIQANVFIGTLCSCGAICYYASPLSTLYEVVKTKDSSSLYAPLSLCSFSNAFLWTIYGLFAKGDVNIWVPNFLGAILSVIQLLAIAFYPRKTHSLPTASPTSSKDTDYLPPSLSPNPSVYSPLSLPPNNPLDDFSFTK